MSIRSMYWLALAQEQTQSQTVVRPRSSDIFEFGIEHSESEDVEAIELFKGLKILLD